MARIIAGDSMSLNCIGQRSTIKAIVGMIVSLTNRPIGLSELEVSKK